MRVSTIVLTIIIIISLLTSMFLISCKPSEEKLNAFAQCLTEKGAIIYGAYGCIHCEEQKEMFGAAVSNLNYIECADNPQICAAAGIKGTPTWKFADNSSLPGVQDFQTLAKKTGCKY